MTPEQKSHAVADIIAVEKGYVNHPSDRGGPTNFGITQAAARSFGYIGDMKDLPRKVAEDIYIKRYIVAPGFDRIFDLDPLIGMELIDTGVNMGPSTAGTFFQRWLNVLNAKGSRYADLFVDGIIGPASASAFQKFLQWRGPEGRTRFLKALNAIQGTRYLEIAEKNESQEDFIYGWLGRI